MNGILLHMKWTLHWIHSLPEQKYCRHQDCFADDDIHDLMASSRAIAVAYCIFFASREALNEFPIHLKNAEQVRLNQKRTTPKKASAKYLNIISLVLFGTFLLFLVTILLSALGCGTLLLLLLLPLLLPLLLLLLTFGVELPCFFSRSSSGTSRLILVIFEGFFQLFTN